MDIQADIRTNERESNLRFRERNLYFSASNIDVVALSNDIETIFQI